MKTLIQIKPLTKCLCIVAIICFIMQSQGQESQGYRIISSNLGSSGSSNVVETSNGVYKISQSVGQSSVIGTHTNNGYYLRQGYQQPLGQSIDLRNFDVDLNAIVFPNPFEKSFTIKFRTSIKDDIAISMYDLNGRIIHSQTSHPTQRVDVLINTISSGTYFLKVTTGTKRFSTKLIKI